MAPYNNRKHLTTPELTLEVLEVLSYPYDRPNLDWTGIPCRATAYPPCNPEQIAHFLSHEEASQVLVEHFMDHWAAWADEKLRDPAPENMILLHMLVDAETATHGEIGIFKYLQLILRAIRPMEERRRAAY